MSGDLFANNSYLAAKLLFIIGAGMGIYGGFETSLWVRGTSSPAQITVAELGQPGWVKNVHVTVSDLRFGDDHVIEKSDDGKWKRVWVPMLTQDGKWTDRPVMAYWTDVDSRQQLAAALRADSFTGVVTNGVQGFGSNQQGQISGKHTNVDLSSVIAIQIGRRFPNPWIVIPLTFTGTMLVIYGLAVTLGWIKYKEEK